MSFHMEFQLVTLSRLCVSSKVQWPRNQISAVSTDVKHSNSSSAKWVETGLAAPLSKGLHRQCTQLHAHFSLQNSLWEGNHKKIIHAHRFSSIVDCSKKLSTILIVSRSYIGQLGTNLISHPLEVPCKLGIEVGSCLTAHWNLPIGCIKDKEHTLLKPCRHWKILSRQALIQFRPECMDDLHKIAFWLHSLVSLHWLTFGSLTLIHVSVVSSGCTLVLLSNCCKISIGSHDPTCN